ncbi:unnamed protein product [Euphydryas editha]|nr:unnamed protein product [Euphydryas editha]
MNSLEKYNTWTMVRKPDRNKKVIDVKWIYKKKSDGEYKARLVTAFQNGKVLSEVYLKQPVGYEDGTDNVYKLNKALYDLKRKSKSMV